MGDGFNSIIQQFSPRPEIVTNQGVLNSTRRLAQWQGLPGIIIGQFTPRRAAQGRQCFQSETQCSSSCFILDGKHIAQSVYVRGRIFPASFKGTIHIKNQIGTVQFQGTTFGLIIGCILPVRIYTNSFIPTTHVHQLLKHSRKVHPRRCNQGRPTFAFTPSNRTGRNILHDDPAHIITWYVGAIPANLIVPKQHSKSNPRKNKKTQFIVLWNLRTAYEIWSKQQTLGNYY